MASVCPSILKFCTVRLTRLNPITGAVSPTANNSYVSDGGQILAFTKEIEAGTESVLKNGCGDIKASSKTPDRFKRWNMTLTMTEFEPAFWEMLTGDSIVNDAGDPVGIDGQDQFAASFVETLVALEGWALAQEGDAPDPVRPYFYMLITASNWTAPDFTVQEEFTVWPFEGFSRTNNSWFTGPYDDTGLLGNVYTHRFAQVDVAPPAMPFGRKE